MKSNEFYIGWLARAPTSFARFVRRCLLALIPLLLFIAVLLALLQKRASTGILETGPTRLTGIFHSLPVPSLRIILGKSINGESLFQMVPLLGYGKTGASAIIRELERKGTLEDSLVTLEGTLLYNDGKAFLQIDNSDSALRSVISGGSIGSSYTPPVKLGQVTLKGEIVDPKCFFGVMKPGEGKPHRDCAIRCILGGIPPVVVVRDHQGRANYFLLVGSQGESMDHAVQDWIAEPVLIRGRLVQYDDWSVLYADANAPISRASYLGEHFGGRVESCGDK